MRILQIPGKAARLQELDDPPSHILTAGPLFEEPNRAMRRSATTSLGTRIGQVAHECKVQPMAARGFKSVVIVVPAFT